MRDVRRYSRMKRWWLGHGKPIGASCLRPGGLTTVCSWRLTASPSESRTASSHSQPGVILLDRTDTVTKDPHCGTEHGTLQIWGWFERASAGWFFLSARSWRPCLRLRESQSRLSWLPLVGASLLVAIPGVVAASAWGQQRRVDAVRRERIARVRLVDRRTHFETAAASIQPRSGAPADPVVQRRGRVHPRSPRHRGSQIVHRR